MTQAFLGQMDGTSRTGMGLKPPKPGSFGFWGPPTTKVEATPLNQEPAKCAIPKERALASSALAAALGSASGLHTPNGKSVGLMAERSQSLFKHGLPFN